MKKILSVLLIITMVITMLPEYLLSVQASEPAWEYMSEAEKNAGFASYDALTDTITFGVTSDFSGRMNYTGIEDVSGKDYAIEFDMTAAGGALGVYNYEKSGELFGVYMDMGAGLLDDVHAQNGAFKRNFWSQDGNTTIGDGIVYFNSGGWDAATDKAGCHIRVEYIRGTEGTLAGGTVNYYKKDNATSNYIALASMAIPQDVADDPNLENYFGIQMWLGQGTVSNITVEEIKSASDDENASWVHMSDAEKEAGYAIYDALSDTITFGVTTDFSGRMNYTGIEDVSGKDYAIEFDMTATGGALGVYNYEESGELFGVYMDTGAGLLDNVHVQNGAFKRNFWSQDGNTTIGDGIVYFNAGSWDATTDKAGCHIRVEYIRGAEGTLAGGTVNYYKKDSTTGEYLTLASMVIPQDVVDDPNSANYFGIQMWYGQGTVSNITIEEIKAISDDKDNNEDENALWKHMSDAEKATGYAAYDAEADKITFGVTSDFSGRMNYTGIEDVSGKDYAIEFDMTAAGGALGVYNYEDSGELFGVYFDMGANLLDNVHIQNNKFLHNFWSQDGNTKVGSGIVYCSNWSSADMASAHIRVEYIRGADGTLAGGTVNYYKKDSTTGKYLSLASMVIPDNVKDDPELANHFGIQMWCGQGTISNITVEEIKKQVAVEKSLWVHMSSAEQNTGNAIYNKANDTISFKTTGDFSGRMNYVGLETVSGKNYAIEFDMTAAGGALGVYNHEESGEMFGVYLDMGAGLLDNVHVQNGTFKHNFWSQDGNTSVGSGIVYCTNWSDADMAMAHIRVEYICGDGGTLAGGTVNYYKRDGATGQYLLLASMKVSSDVKDDPNSPNYFGIQMWLGEGTVSNIKITEIQENEQIPIVKSPTWLHFSGAEKEVGDAVYNEESGTITFSGSHGWSSRLLNTEIEDMSGESFAVEFDANLGSKGVIGISAFCEDATHFYNVYFNYSECLLDGVGIMGVDNEGEIIVIDDFSYVNDTIYPHFFTKTFSPTRGENVKFRIECFLGADGTMADGTAHFYFKRHGFSEWTHLGVIALPDTIEDNPDVPNRLMIHGREANGSISNIKVIRDISSPILSYKKASNSKEWGYVSDYEKLIGAAEFNDKLGEMTLGYNGGWSTRMLCLTVPDVTDKAFALEFDAECNVGGGALGVIPFYEDADNWYGLYLDRASKRIDGAGFSDGDIFDDFDYVDSTYFSSVLVTKAPIINQFRYRFEYFPNSEGLASGAICRLYYKQMPSGRIVDDTWRFVGEYVIPDTLVDRPEVPNKIMISARLLCGTLSDISYTEIDPLTQTEYYNGPEDYEFEDGYPVDDYMPVSGVDNLQAESAPWWGIAMIILGGSTLLALVLWKFVIPVAKRRKHEKEI